MVEFTYDAAGNVTGRKIRNSAGGTIVFNQTQVFDELGRLLKHIGAATPTPQTTTLGYDKTGNLKSVTDPRSGIYAYAYDGLQRVKSETDQGLAVVNLTKNAQDQISAYSDPRALVTSYVLDGFGEVIRESSPDTGVTDKIFDARGLVTQLTDARLVVQNFTYDNAGRLLTKAFPAAAPENVTYTYDSIAAGNKGKGRLTSVIDESGSSAFVYDARGNVLSETHIIAGKTYLVAYTYDSADHILSITYPSGRIVTYIRDALGRVTSVTTKKTAADPAVNLATGMTWKPYSGLLAGLTYGNGLTESDTFTLDYELSRLLVQDGLAAIIDRQHNRTDLLNLTGIADAVTPANSATFGYSPANRLNASSGPWGSSTWAYDAVGNRTQEITGASTLGYTYPASSNKLSGIALNGVSNRTFTYDANGNILTDVRAGVTYAFTYNKANRLKTATVGGNLKATYTYNAMGQLAIRVLTNLVPSGTIHSIYDLDGNLIVEGNDLGQTVREYLWLPETEIAPTFGSRAPAARPLAVVDGVNGLNPALFNVQVDHLNRPIRMTNSAKAAVWTAVWKPFGEPQSITGAASLDARFPGQWFQLEAGLHYNWFRSYDPTTGRYTQADPLGFVDGPSVYGYARGKVSTSVDLSGRAAVVNDTGHPVVVTGSAGIDHGHPGGGDVLVTVVLPPGGRIDRCHPAVDSAGNKIYDVDAYDRDGDGTVKFPQGHWQYLYDFVWENKLPGGDLSPIIHIKTVMGLTVPVPYPGSVSPDCECRR